MFPANETMNIFTDARGHDRLSLVYRPFTIDEEEEEEVTFSEAEDVSVEKGRDGGGKTLLFVHEHEPADACDLLFLVDLH